MAAAAICFMMVSLFLDGSCCAARRETGWFPVSLLPSRLLMEHALTEIELRFAGVLGDQCTMLAGGSIRVSEWIDTEHLPVLDHDVSFFQPLHANPDLLASGVCRQSIA